MAENGARILCCTVGAAPQVVTETIWCLTRPPRPWIPDEIHIITTAFRLDLIRSALQSADGPLGNLMNGAPPTIVHVPRRRGAAISLRHGDPIANPDELLRDVNSDEEAAQMGNLILRVLADVTSQQGSSLHVSLAGGRKTMSAHALMALSLVGRPGDKVSHVLVDPEYEDHPDFWYPGQGGTLTPKPGSRRTETFDPAAANVTLVPTPAPLMRNRVLDRENLGALDLLDLMKKANLAAALEERPTVRLSVKENSVCAYDETIRLSPKFFAVYRLLATARKESWPGAGPKGVGPANEGWLTFEQIATGISGTSPRPIRDLMTQYVREAEIVIDRFIDDKDSNTQTWMRSISSSDDYDRTKDITGNLNQDITRLKDAIAKAVGIDAAAVLAPMRDFKRRGQARFGLVIDPNSIELS